MFENLLPIGTVVCLKGTVTKVMITGFKQISNKEKRVIKDYSAVIYPIGSLGSNSLVMFDSEDIQDIIFTGYKNPEFDEMIEALEKKAAEDPVFAESIRERRAAEENKD